MSEWMITPVTPDAAERVRGGVTHRIRRRRNARRGAGGLAVLVALAFCLWPSPPELEMLALTPPPPPLAPLWSPPLPPKRQPVIMAQADSRPAERITIFTSDPDVVIVLVADGGE